MKNILLKSNKSYPKYVLSQCVSIILRYTHK